MDNIIYWTYASGGAQHYDDDLHDIEDPPLIFNANYPAGANGFSAVWENVGTVENFDEVVPSFEDIWDDNNQTQTHVMIQPSGQQSVGQTALYLVQAQVTNEDTHLQLPGNQAQIQGITLTDVTDTNGTVWSEALVSAPAGAQIGRAHV